MKNDVVMRACGRHGADVQVVELDGENLSVVTDGRTRAVPLPDDIGEVAAVGVGPVVVGADGRAHTWNGRGWSSPKSPPHVPVITVRRASYRLDGLVECVVQHPWAGGEHDHGTVVLLDPVEFEARRRAGLVRGVPRSKRTMMAVVLRTWRADLREGQKIRLPDAEIEARSKRGECDFVDPLEKPTSAAPATVRALFFEAVGLGGFLDARAGEVHELLHSQAVDLEWRNVATLLYDGDVPLVDGVPVEKVGPLPPQVEQPRSWIAGIFAQR